MKWFVYTSRLSGKVGHREDIGLLLLFTILSRRSNSDLSFIFAMSEIYRLPHESVMEWMKYER